MAQTASSDTGGSATRSEVQRLFFALWPDAQTRLRLSQAVESLRVPHAQAGRWSAPGRYHLTLQFLGDFAPLPCGLIDAACTAAESVRVVRFALTLDRAGSFRNRSIPWWLGCSQIPAALQVLWDQLGSALLKGRVRYDTRREFTPHLTILRDARSLLPAMAVAPVSWSVHEFVLMESRLGGAGAGYAVLRRFPLQQ